MPKRTPVKYTDEQIQQMMEWLHKMPERFHRTYKLAMEGNNLRAAINGKCQDCMNWTIGEVHRCDVVTCTLWPYKPKSSKNRSKSVEA